MGNFNPTPNIGTDGQDAPGYSSLIAGKNTSGKHKDISAKAAGSLITLPVSLIDSLGNQVDLPGSSASIGDGTATLTNAGDEQQLSVSSVPCKRVFVQAAEGNDGVIVVGASTVVGALVGRRGKALFATQGDWFAVDNLNRLYFDGTNTGDKVHFYYES